MKMLKALLISSRHPNPCSNLHSFSLVRRTTRCSRYQIVTISWFRTDDPTRQIIWLQILKGTRKTRRGKNPSWLTRNRFTVGLILRSRITRVKQTAHPDPLTSKNSFFKLRECVDLSLGAYYYYTDNLSDAIPIVCSTYFLSQSG